MQWRVLLAILFALVVAVFAVVNVHAEPVRFVFGVAYVPLILIILGSALLGALVVAMFGVVSQVQLRRENRRLRQNLKDCPAKELTSPGKDGEAPGGALPRLTAQETESTNQTGD
ncbi:LapA family protein [Alicyclobacillaceae bacterium I2511]|nr:LapA family protein [Alicyclobacillaceae bacterium I2511]